MNGTMHRVTHLWPYQNLWTTWHSSIAGPQGAESLTIAVNKAAYETWRKQMIYLRSNGEDKWSKGPCDRCLEILWKIANVGKHDSQWYHTSAKLHWESDTILENSSKKCDLCKLFLESIARSKIEQWERNLILEDVEPYIGHLESYDYSIGLRWLDHGVWKFHIRGGGHKANSPRIYIDEDDVLADRVIARPVERRSGSVEMLAKAKAWIEECYTTHSDCRVSLSDQGDAKLPTRVLEIDDDGAIRLFLTNGKSGKWAALSHRWGVPSWTDRVFKGRQTFSKTLTSNLAQLKQEIPKSQLPATFLDAITITRAIGLKYLWIDSLCIIQDSAEDWQAESGAMAAVYRDSYFTISAGASKNSYGGIFNERAWVKGSEPVKFPVISGEKMSTVNFDFDHFHPSSGLEAKDNYLRSRAWCFQETHLSPRRLTFDPQQMSFTCLQGTYREGDSAFESRHEFRNDYLRQYWGLSESENYETLPGLWKKLVEDYSARDLTFSSDKLVAISSIAGMIGERLNDEYLAGIWRRGLPRDLLWSPHRSKTLSDIEYRDKLQNPDTYRAPSWSWTSIEGPIGFDYCSSDSIIASVLEVEVHISSPLNPYGQVSSGSLKIRGPLRRAFCGFQTGHSRLCQPLYWEKNSVYDKSDYPDARCMFDTTPVEEGSKVYCLQITAVAGLVLLPSSVSPRNYTRIGVFDHDDGIPSYVIMGGGDPSWFQAKGQFTIVIV